MPKSLHTLLSKLYYDYLPDSLRKCYGPRVERLYSLLHRLRTVFSDLYLPVTCLTSRNSDTAPQLKITTAGRDDTARHFFHSMNPPVLETADQTHHWKIPLWKVSRLNVEKANVLLVEADRCFSPYLRTKGFITIPHQVNFTLDISMPKEDILQGYKKRNWSNYQKFARQQYTYEPANSPDTVRQFYDRMYRPYIQSRHGKWAQVKSFAYIKNLVYYGELLLVKKEDAYVGGFIINTSTSTPRLSYIGILDGKQNYLKNGLSPAIYYFSVCWAKERGYTKMDFGHCKPFLEDGILRFKRQWGMRMERSPRVYRAIHLLLGEPNISFKQFLINNPLICEEHRRLKGLFFLNSETVHSEQQVEALEKRYTMPGLNSFSVVQLSDDSPP